MKRLCPTNYGKHVIVFQEDVHNITNFQLISNKNITTVRCGQVVTEHLFFRQIYLYTSNSQLI